MKGEIRMDRNLTIGILNKIFKKPDTQFGLTEFENIKPQEILEIFEKDKNHKSARCGY